MRMRPHGRFLLGLVAVSLVAASPAISSRAEEGGLEPINVGTPARIEVFPAAVKLVGPRSRMQLVVTGHYADGTLQDLTRAAQFATNNAAIVTVEGSVARPHQEGAAEIIVTVGGQEAKLPVEVAAFGT